MMPGTSYAFSKTTSSTIIIVTYYTIYCRN